MGFMKYKGYTGSVEYSEEDNCLFGKVQGMTSQKFLKKLEAFALLCPWVEDLNPAEVRNNSGRIIRREEGAPPGTSPVEMIYMKKKEESAIPGPEEGEIWEDGKPFL